jgi:hypothetical protein
MAEKSTGIVGNTERSRQDATSSRIKDKLQNKSTTLKISIGITLLAITILLANSGLNFFWKLVLALILYKVGNSLAGQKIPSEYTWVWPQILKYSGVGLFFFTMLNSGFGNWTEQFVQGVEESVSCSANPSQKKCSEPSSTSLFSVISNHDITEDCLTKRNSPYYLTKPTVVTLCKDNPHIVILTKDGYKVNLEYDNKFRELYSDLLNNRTVENFAYIESKPWGDLASERRMGHWLKTDRTGRFTRVEAVRVVISPTPESP